jgi:hypothetical protein
MSSSMDKTIVIWRFDSEAGVWMDDVSNSDATTSCTIQSVFVQSRVKYV